MDPIPTTGTDKSLDCLLPETMNLKENFPYMVMVNLGLREDRRDAAYHNFAKYGFEVDRQPGVPKQVVRDTRGYHAKGRYACSLAKRLAIRRARLAGAPSMILYEDDLVFSPRFIESVEKIELPDDWGIFFFGCRHLSAPVPVSDGLVRVTRALDNHAMGIRREYFGKVMSGLSGVGKGRKPFLTCSDVKLSGFLSEIPTYAAYPNLIWQGYSHSDTLNHEASNYFEDGRQSTDRNAVRFLELGPRR